MSDTILIGGAKIYIDIGGKTKWLLYHRSSQDKFTCFSQYCNREAHVYNTTTNNVEDISYLVSNGILPSIKLCRVHAFKYFTIPLLDSIFKHTNDMRNIHPKTQPALILRNKSVLYCEYNTTVEIEENDLVIGWRFIENIYNSQYRK